MNCYVHNERSAVGACVECGKFICEDCKTEVANKYYCKNCLGNLYSENKQKKEEMIEYMRHQQSSNRRVTAALLALFLGGLGIHKFYLGKKGAGIVYLLFCWTFIPAFIALIEGISYLCLTDEAFDIKYESVDSQRFPSKSL